MLGKVFAILILCGVGYGGFSGRLAEVSAGALAGASQAVEVTVLLVGSLCLWNGLLAVFSAAGGMRGLARLLSPLLRVLFPRARACGAEEPIAAALAANLLGLGNAATPLALSAMRAMQTGAEDKETASDDMVTFTVLATASVSLFPSTLLSLRAAAGSADPFAVVPLVWVASLAGATVAVLTSKCLARLSFVRRRRRRYAIF